jgi:hypothetical protein
MMKVRLTKLVNLRIMMKVMLDKLSSLTSVTTAGEIAEWIEITNKISKNEQISKVAQFGPPSEGQPPPPGGAQPLSCVVGELSFSKVSINDTGGGASSAIKETAHYRRVMLGL